MLPAANNCFVSDVVFEKCISLPNPQKANVDYIKNNHPVSSLPLLSRVITKTIIIKLQNIDVFFSSASLLTCTHDLIYFAFIGRPGCSRVDSAPPSLFLLLCQ